MNAKELILYRINGGTNLARCYLHLIMMGFDIKDIISFMTSPVVSVIDQLSSASMFDEYIPKQSVYKVLDILNGKFPVNKFIHGTKRVEDRDSDY